MRETILRALASRAATDPDFLRRARQDLTGTLTRDGYQLTEGELRLVEGLQRQTAGMSDEELARTLAGGVQGGRSNPPTRPAGPRSRDTIPARPARLGA